MNFHSYTIFDKVSGFYFYTISHIDDPEFILDVIESYADANPQDPINEYFTLVSGWDNVNAEKATITPTDIINKYFRIYNVMNIFFIHVNMFMYAIFVFQIFR